MTTARDALGAFDKLYKILGFNSDGSPMKFERKTYKCNSCGSNKAYHREMHPDTDMNYMELYCPDCKHRKEV